jgi:hypothetical protein
VYFCIFTGAVLSCKVLHGGIPYVCCETAYFNVSFSDGVMLVWLAVPLILGTCHWAGSNFALLGGSFHSGCDGLGGLGFGMQ